MYFGLWLILWLHYLALHINDISKINNNNNNNNNNNGNKNNYNGNNNGNNNNFISTHFCLQ